MSELRKRLQEMNVVPPREGGKFDAWLEQKDAVAFLKSNAQEPELIVYASLSHMFVHSVLVPVSALDPINEDDLLRWSCNPSDSWGTWSTDTSVGLAPPLHHPGSKTLEHGEQLVFTRHFEGHIGRKSYVEVLQKFTQIFDIHYVPERDAYCWIDKHGDVEDMIRIVAVSSKGEPSGDRFVSFDRRLLDEYLFVTNSALVRLFDFTRVDFRNFGGWTDARKEKRIAEGELYARVTTEAGKGSYLRGFQIIRTGASEQSVINRAWGKDEEKQYASFIAYDWKNQVVDEISCDPKCLSNYFTKSDLPYEVTPAFFRAEVLRKYKADSEKYVLEERSITCRGAWHLKTYDINEAGQVHTYLVYLSQLPYREQLYWKSFNEEPRASISKRAFTTDFKGEFTTEFEPVSSLKYRVRELSRSQAPWWTLRASDLINKVHTPVTAAADEWADDILALDQLVIEGLEGKWLRQHAQSLGRSPDVKVGSIKLLEECLIGLGFDGDHASSVTAPLRELHDLRTKLKGHASDESRRALRSKALTEHGTYRKQFMDLCARCDASFAKIEQALKVSQ